jgi:hypothetical protein
MERNDVNEPLDRKAALRAYKERKPRPGIYAVREVSSGRAWAGSTQNLDTTKNGLWLSLNAGRHLDRSLQANWKQLGEAAFEYVVLEVIEEDLGPLVLKETLKAKRAEWARMLAEGPIS